MLPLPQFRDMGAFLPLPCPCCVSTFVLVRHSVLTTSDQTRAVRGIQLVSLPWHSTYLLLARLINQITRIPLHERFDVHWAMNGHGHELER